MKSWLKNLSNEYIYAEQNPSRTRDISIQSWPFRSRKRPRVSLKFWLWRSVPEKWQVTRGFMLWFFLNWSIDYQIKNSKTKFGRITFWILTTLFPTVRFPPNETQWVLSEFVCEKSLNVKDLMTSRRIIRIIFTEFLSGKHGTNQNSGTKQTLQKHTPTNPVGKKLAILFTLYITIIRIKNLFIFCAVLLFLLLMVFVKTNIPKKKLIMWKKM